MVKLTSASLANAQILNTLISLHDRFLYLPWSYQHQFMKMSTVSAPPPDGNRNRASELVAITWTWCIFSMVFVALRFYSRTRITHNIWWDDWFILITMVCALEGWSGVDWSTDNIRFSSSPLHFPHYGLYLPRTMAVDIFTIWLSNKRQMWPRSIGWPSRLPLWLLLQGRFLSPSSSYGF